MEMNMTLEDAYGWDWDGEVRPRTLDELAAITEAILAPRCRSCARPESAHCPECGTCSYYDGACERAACGYEED